MTQSINELKSYTEYNVSTPTSVFTIGFQYEYNVDQVNVYVDDVEATVAGYTITHDTHGTLELTPAVPSGVVLLQRETNIDGMLHTFSAGAKFIARNMDDNFKQVRHAQQEVRDVVISTASEFSTLEANATAALQAATAAVNTANSIDAKATTALSNSSTALSVANGVDAKATLALSSANTAESNANAALSTANTAQSVANGVDAKATQAQLDASTALSTVTTQKGAANGIATLDANTLIPTTQLPQATTTNIGAVEIATPTEVNTATDNTGVVTPSTLLSGVKNHLNVSGNAPMYACRAWADWDGVNNTLKAGGNISSVTDNGVGNYTFNLATALPDVNYAVSAILKRASSANAFVFEVGTRTTSTCSLSTKQDDAGSQDGEMSVIIVR